MSGHGTQSETFVANIDLSAKQYNLVVTSGSNLMGAPSAAGVRVAGVLTTAPNSGKNGTVRMLGRTRIRAGGAIVGGGGFTTNASGEAVAVTSGDYAAGQAITGVASGGIFVGLIDHAGYTIG